jgi:hypothetical protein
MPTQRADHHQKRRPVRDLGLIRGEVGILRYIALCLSNLHWRHLRACYSRQAFPEIPGAEHMCTSAGAAPLDRPEEDHRRLRFKGNIPMNLMLLCCFFFHFLMLHSQWRVIIIASSHMQALRPTQDPTGTSHSHAGNSAVSFDALYNKGVSLASIPVV